jgi:hypothetical protein
VQRFLQDIGIALGKGRLIRLHPTSDGGEICSLYRSHAEALAAATRVRD